jgi:hypothetical protein
MTYSFCSTKYRFEVIEKMSLQDSCAIIGVLINVVILVLDISKTK